MPKRTKGAPSQWSRGTLEELSAALGAHRNSLREWLKAGAPDGPPYDEYLWRAWMAGNGKVPKALPSGELLKQLAAAGIPEYVRAVNAARSTPAPPSAPAVQRSLDSLLYFDALPEQQAQALKYLDARSKVLDLKVREGVLVPVALLDQVVEALAGCCVHLFSQLPGVAAEFTSHVEDQERLRQLLAKHTNGARSALRATAAAALARLLEAVPR